MHTIRGFHRGKVKTAKYLKQLNNIIVTARNPQWDEPTQFTFLIDPIVQDPKQKRILEKLIVSLYELVQGFVLHVYAGQLRWTHILHNDIKLKKGRNAKGCIRVPVEERITIRRNTNPKFIKTFILNFAKSRSHEFIYVRHE